MAHCPVEKAPPQSDRTDLTGPILVIAYLAAHAIWRQMVWGPYSFVILRVVFLLVFAAVLIKQERGADLRRFLVGRPTPPASLWREVVLILFCALLCRLGMDAYYHFETVPFTPRDFLDSCLIAPINEEIVFRGVFLSVLLTGLPTRPFVAVFLAATIFAGCHNLGEFQPLVPLLLLGLICGWAYARTRSVLFCILCHAVWNAGSYAPFLHTG